MFPYISFKMKFLKIIIEESITVWDTLSFYVDFVTMWTSRVWKQERRTRAKERKGGIHLQFRTAKEPLGWTWMIRDARDTRRWGKSHERTCETTCRRGQKGRKTETKVGDRSAVVKRGAGGANRDRQRPETGKVKARHKDINHLPLSCSEKSEAPKL